MRNDTAASGEFRINLPPDVLAEMRRQTASPRAAMQVDGFRPGTFWPTHQPGDRPPPLIPPVV